MGAEIEIDLDDESFKAELRENETAKGIADKLPVQASPSYWGDEIYFEIPVDIGENEQVQSRYGGIIPSPRKLTTFNRISPVSTR